jgi:AraC family transcriptional regulator
LTKDYTVFQTGNSSGCFYAKDIVGKEQFGVTIQEFKVDNYKEKRLKLYCILKTEDVMKCSVWMQVNNAFGDMIQFDNTVDLFQ